MEGNGVGPKGETQVAMAQALQFIIRAFGALGAGALGRQLQQDTEKLLRERQKPGADQMQQTPPLPPMPDVEPPKMPEKTVFPAEPVELPDLSLPIPDPSEPTIFIHTIPPEDLGKIGMIVKNKGNEETRAELERIRDTILKANPDWEHIGGGRDRDSGEEKTEYWIPSSAKDFEGDGRPGGKFTDLTFETPSGQIFHVQTVDMDKNGKPTQREQDNADFIFRRTGHSVILYPKGAQVKRKAK